MNLTRCASGFLFLLLLWQPPLIHAQAKTAQVTQVLPFASAGVVTTTAASSETENTGNQNTGSSSASVQTGTIPIAEAGGKISTDETGATSLVLGNLGAAQMGADSEVKVPTSSEGGQSLELLKGKLFLNIDAEALKKRDSSEFRLKTPAALLAVKGTRFFTMSMDGKDIIGVHEGSVLVKEIINGSEMTLSAGYAVDLSPGLMSAAREMTVEETEHAEEYKKADLIQTPILINRPRGDVDLPPYLEWDNYGSSPFDVKPQWTGQGSVLYTWVAQKERNATGYLFAAPRFIMTQKTIAVSFRLRCKNIARIEVTHGDQRGYLPSNPTLINLKSVSRDGEWITAVLPLMPPSDKRNRPSYGIKVQPFVNLPETGLINKTSSAVELRDFVLLSDS